MNWKKSKDAAAKADPGAEKAAPGAVGPAAFVKKNWKWLVPVVCVVALGGWFILRPSPAQNTNVDINYVQTTPEKRDVTNTLSGTGILNPANTYNVKSLVAGKVLTSTAEEGDIVEEGDVLYTVDSSDATTKAEQASIALQQAQRSYDKTVDRQYVRAEVAGIVSTLKVAKGDEVTSGQEVAVIRDSSKMTLQLEFPAADAASFSVGQSAEVTLDGTFETITGTVTAASSSGRNDGASCMLLMTEEKAKELGLKPICRIIGMGTAGCDPRTMGLGPVYAVPKALKNAGLTMDDIQLIELNEAFAAQSLGCIKQLHWEDKMDIINVNGGAIALGHPVGSSGCRILVTLMYEMKKRGLKYGLATLCIAGGMGQATVIEMCD